MNRDFILRHGKHGYVIHDFSNNDTFRINDRAGAILAKAEAGVHIGDIADQLSIDEQSVQRRLESFAERGVGRFYSSRVYIEKYKKGVPFAKYQFFRSPPVISRCFIELPGKCQLRCGYCESPALFPCNICSLSDDRPDIWMLKRALKRVIKINCISLIFHGGDPLANLDQFASVVEFCRSEGFIGNINVLTNGSLIDDDSARFLRKFNISPIVPAFLDHQTSTGFRFKVDMERLASMCKGHEVPFTLVAVSQAGKTDIGRFKNEIMEFGPASVTDAVVFDNDTCLNSNILPDNILDMMLPLTADYYYHSLSHHPCLSGTLAISADGRIRPCPHIDSKDLGNIVSEDALDIVFEERLIDKYWELGLSGIEQCRQCELQNRCFDCRAFEIGITGNVLGKKYCTLGQSRLEEMKID